MKLKLLLLITTSMFTVGAYSQPHSIECDSAPGPMGASKTQIDIDPVEGTDLYEVRRIYEPGGRLSDESFSSKIIADNLVCVFAEGLASCFADDLEVYIKSETKTVKVLDIDGKSFENTRQHLFLEGWRNNFPAPNLFIKNGSCRIL